jgi:hypothetical protein
LGGQIEKKKLRGPKLEEEKIRNKILFYYFFFGRTLGLGRGEDPKLLGSAPG